MTENAAKICGNGAILPDRIAGPTVVIGDVHGEAGLLGCLLERILARPDADERWIVFCGDLIDRGPDSHQVLDLVTSLAAAHPRTTAVMGNHELALVGALGLVPTPRRSNWDLRYLKDYAATPTFVSYGVGVGDLAALRRALPEPHSDFIRRMPWAIEIDEGLIVHAGLQGQEDYETQRQALCQRDFTHNRSPWLCDRELFATPLPTGAPVVISGHIHQPKVVLRPRRILLDTGCGHGGPLSAVLLPEREVISVSPVRD